MNCNDAASLIAAYVDGETGRKQTRAIGNHLVGCRECAVKHEDLLALRAQLRAEVPRYSAPPALRARVLATLEAARRGCLHAGDCSTAGARRAVVQRLVALAARICMESSIVDAGSPAARWPVARPPCSHGSSARR
jgi:anti-sigma factor RsiW